MNKITIMIKIVITIMNEVTCDEDVRFYEIRPYRSHLGGPAAEQVSPEEQFELVEAHVFVACRRSRRPRRLIRC